MLVKIHKLTRAAYRRYDQLNKKPTPKRGWGAYLVADQALAGSQTESEADNQTGDKIRVDLETKVQEVLHLEAEAQAVLNTAQDQQIRSLPSNSPDRESAVVEESLKKHFKELLDVATEAELSESSIKRIQKAKRVMVQMVATIAFFFLTVRCQVEALQLEEEVEKVVLEQLIPAIYLDLVSNRGNNSQERQAIKKRSSLMLALVNNSDSPLAELSVYGLVDYAYFDSRYYECRGNGTFF